jgi:DNA polymerase III delta subunit
VTLNERELLSLRGLEPWTLDMVDQELSKLELLGNDPALRQDALSNGVSSFAQDRFMDAIFTRNPKIAFELMHLFVGDMETLLPFLGLVSWNVRQLKLYLLEQDEGASPQARRMPRLQENLDRWKRFWNRRSIQLFEHSLFEIDFSLKNTRLSAFGLWSELIMDLKSGGVLS